MKRTFAEKTFNVFNITFMLLIAVIMIYPYLNQMAISFNEGADSARGGITIFPRVFTLQNYKAIFTNQDFLRAAIVSVCKTVLNTLVATFINFSAAYGLTRRGLPYRKAITLYLMIPAYISAGVIPMYMLYRDLHIINTFWVYVFPVLYSFYNIVIIRSFLQELPASLEESAKLDGATDFRIMIKIIVPISMPVIATVALWSAVNSWNGWTDTLMYVTDKKLFTLQYLMMRLVKESEMAQQMALQLSMGQAAEDTVKTTSESVKAASLIVTTIPIIAVYPFLQKYFIKGVTLGAVKE